MQLTGSQRCAVFLLAMGEDVATDMLGRMQRQEVARITEAMASLPHVPESEVRAILREARIFLETQADGICADRALAGRLLAHCLGEREARETMRAWGPAESARPFESLERMRPGQLYQLLRQEHPQTLALVLGHLSASQAAGLLMRLPTEMRSLLLEHIGGLAPVDADILDEVDSVLARQAAERSVQDWRPGLQVAAEIVAAAGKDAARELLADLERHDSRLPSLLGRMVHCPEDCLKLEDGLLEEALEETSGEALVGVLDTCGPAVRTALLEHVPEARRSAIERRLREGETSPGQSATYREDFLRRVRHLQAERLQADLDAAYAAYRQKRKYVRLKDGTFLSEEALDQAAQLEKVLESAGLSVEDAQRGDEMPRERALYLEQALAQRKGVSLDVPKALSEWMRRLEDAQKTQVEAPRGLCAELRPYQRTGLSWLSALSDAGFGGILADDMGLGKTVQALALLLRERAYGRPVRALVVCPASLQLNWRSEAARFAPDLPCVALLGTAAVRQGQIEAWRDGILITSYDQLRRDVLAYRDMPLTHALLDEAQNIKNAASQAAKAVKTLNAAHRFALTGTPIENRLSELWSIFDFLMPGYLHAYKRFRERFEAPIVQDADEQARQNLHLMVAPFILRRMKKDVLDDLPDKIETVMTSEMTPGQAKVYHAYAEKLMRDAESELADPQGRMRLLAGLTRLRQLCCDPRLCLEGYDGGSGKLEQLLELVRDMAAQGHRMLIFSQFTSMLALLEDALHEAGFETLKLTGETDKAKRMALVEQFNGGDTPVFLISLKAGGTGLNLVGADVVIHYDPWWNTAAQNQATDRAYRIGQTKGVQVFSLIAAGTIEERIVLLQEEKKALSDGVLLGEDSLFTVDAAALREILKA